MDTRFLETFLMAVDNGSIAEAARRLNLTAAAIVERARRFVIEARDFESIAATGRPSGQLRLGTFQSALSGLLPDILVLMKQNYPQIDVNITLGISAELYRKVLDGDDLDAVIIAQPPFAIPKSCDWGFLREEPLIVLTRAPAPSRKPHAILASEPFIRLHRRLWPGRLVDGYLRKAGIRPRELYEIDLPEAIAVMVDRGLGVSLLPDWAPPWPEGLSLAKLPLPDAGPYARRIGVVWARASPRLRLVYAFLEQAAAQNKQRRKEISASSNAGTPVIVT